MIAVSRIKEPGTLHLMSARRSGWETVGRMGHPEKWSCWERVPKSAEVCTLGRIADLAGSPSGDGWWGKVCKSASLQPSLPTVLVGWLMFCAQLWSGWSMTCALTRWKPP